MLNDDTTDLIERLADVQQDKWLLEEKVHSIQEPFANNSLKGAITSMSLKIPVLKNLFLLVETYNEGRRATDIKCGKEENTKITVHDK